MLRRPWYTVIVWLAAQSDHQIVVVHLTIRNLYNPCRIINSLDLSELEPHIRLIPQDLPQRLGNLCRLQLNCTHLV